MKLNNKYLYSLLTQCIYVLHKILRIKADYISIKEKSRLVSTMETQYVFCEEGTELLNA